MKVVENSYTGEEIKRIEFSTGDPFFYISFFTPKNDFSAGYFLIDSKAYSILAKELTYAETDLVFSFISPVEKSVAKPLEINIKSVVIFYESIINTIANLFVFNFICTIFK